MNVQAFIDQWDKRADLAGDIGVKADAVHKWAQNGSIPAKYHFDVLQAARRRGFMSDPMVLAEIHRPQAETGSAA